jgi:hypothetical protein
MAKSQIGSAEMEIADIYTNDTLGGVWEVWMFRQEVFIESYYVGRLKDGRQVVRTYDKGKLMWAIPKALSGGRAL